MNFNSFIANNIENNKLFFTNNIVETFIKTLNKKYIGMLRTLFNYKNAIKEIININNEYQKRR